MAKKSKWLPIALQLRGLSDDDVAAVLERLARAAASNALSNFLHAHLERTETDASFADADAESTRTIWESTLAEGGHITDADLF
jgi:hypothetical protein